jgi:hypothetical protein
MTLFTIHADVIQEDMQRQFASQATPEDQRRFLGEFLQVFEPEMQTARTLAKYYPRLGFDPDYLMYRSRVFPFLENTHAMSRRQIADFCRTSFLSAIWNQPFGYVRKVFVQLGYFLFPDDATFFRKRIEMGKLYDYVRTTVPDTLDMAFSKPARDLYQTYRENVVARRASPESRGLPALRAFSEGPCGGWILYRDCVFRVARRLPDSQISRPVPASGPDRADVFPWLLAGNALTALIHASIIRYRGSYGPLLLFALRDSSSFF